MHLLPRIKRVKTRSVKSFRKVARDSTYLALLESMPEYGMLHAITVRRRLRSLRWRGAVGGGQGIGHADGADSDSFRQEYLDG